MLERTVTRRGIRPAGEGWRLMVRGAVAALVIAGVLAVPALGAVHARHTSSPTRRVARLNKTVRRLRVELRQQKTQLKHELAAERAATIKAQQQAAEASATLTQVNGQLSSAQTQVAALQAQLNAIPSPLSVAVEQVRREVAWSQGGTSVAPSAPDYGQLVSMAAMDYTAGHVSTAAYGYLEALYGEAPGGPDLPPYGQPVNTTLATQTGICGHAGRVFAAIVTRFGLQVRGVNFGYTDPGGSPDGHFAVEVYYGGGWHFFDPTFDQFWRDASGNVLSIADVRAGLGTLVRNNTLYSNLIQAGEAPGGNVTWFETDPATGVAYVDPSLFVS